MKNEEPCIVDSIISIRSLFYTIRSNFTHRSKTNIRNR